MDIARWKSIAVLGYNFNLHLLRSLIPRRKKDQAELFLGYFRDDRIAALTAEEQESLEQLQGCVVCGLCPAYCRVMEQSPGRFKGPMHIAATASRSQPEFAHDLDSILLCAVCGQCEPICPERVPVSKAARHMRAMIWRVAGELLPEAYKNASLNLAQHGNIYGPPRAEASHREDAEALLVLGPLLRRHPGRANAARETLAGLGYDIATIEEGTIGGVARDIGLAPDTAWVDRLQSHPAGKVIVADPEAWLALADDERLAGKRPTFILEAIMERRPEGAALKDRVKGPVAVHEPCPLARHSYMGELARGMLERASLQVVEMDPAGIWSPPMGWEGGIDLAHPELAERLARSRLEDARDAGAASIVTLCADDALMLERAAREGDPGVVWIVEGV